MLFCYFEVFLWEIHRDLLFLIKKIDYLRKDHKNTQKFVFLNKFEKDQILRKIWIFLINYFDQTSKMREILIKTVFLSNVSHIQLNYAFLLLWNIFGKIPQRTSLFSPKMTISERSTEILRKFIFVNIFKKGANPEENLDLFKIFFDQTSKMGEILTKTCYSPKTMLFCCFEAFMGISQRTCLFSQKSDILRKEHRNTQKDCLS